MEDNNALPSLQDLFEDLDETKLEDFAESLLADITADLEKSLREGDPVATEDSSKAEQLFGSLVGTTTEIMESTSSTTTTISNSVCIKNDLEVKKKDEIPCKKQSKRKNIKNDSTISDPETLYGTYDEKTNSITIVMPDGSVPVQEFVEEIICDDQSESISNNEDDTVCLAESVINNSLSLDDDTDFDPVKEFLSLPCQIDDSAKKSPYSLHSDHGYVSIGSPYSNNSDDGGQFEIWNESFSELFPSLI